MNGAGVGLFTRVTCVEHKPQNRKYHSLDVKEQSSDMSNIVADLLKRGPICHRTKLFCFLIPIACLAEVLLDNKLWLHVVGVALPGRYILRTFWDSMHVYFTC